MADPTSSTQHARRGQPDRIVVNGLVVDAYIGVHDFEHEAPQRVRFDVEIDTVDDYADRVRTAGAYVSYADVVEFMAECVESDVRQLESCLVGLVTKASIMTVATTGRLMDRSERNIARLLRAFGWAGWSGARAGAEHGRRRHPSA